MRSFRRRFLSILALCSRMHKPHLRSFKKHVAQHRIINQVEVKPRYLNGKHQVRGRSRLTGMHAALDKTSGVIGFGVIARDSEGQVLAARCYSKQVCIDLIMAESWAGLQAVLFCKEVGLFDIVLE